MKNMCRPKSAKDRLFLKSFHNKEYSDQFAYYGHFFVSTAITYSAYQNYKTFQLHIDSRDRINCIVKTLIGIDHGEPEYSEQRHHCKKLSEARQFFKMYNFKIKR